MHAKNNALAQLDNGHSGAEDEDMSPEMETLRQEMGAGFKEVNARIDELRRETTARIDELRKETADNFKLVDAKFEQIRRETADHSLAVNAQIHELQRDTTSRLDGMHRDISSRIGNMHRETTIRIDTMIHESQKRMDRSDAQFRWLVALIVSSFLGIFGLLAKAGAVF